MHLRHCGIKRYSVCNKALKHGMGPESRLIIISTIDKSIIYSRTYNRYEKKTHSWRQHWRFTPSLTHSISSDKAVDISFRFLIIV